MFCPHGKKKILLQIQRAKAAGIENPLLSLNLSAKTSSGHSDYGSRDSSPKKNESIASSSTFRPGKSSSDNVKVGMDEESKGKSQPSIASTVNLLRILEDVGPKGRVLKRIMDSTSRYRPDRDAITMKAFQNNAISYVLFRHNLHSAFWLIFSDAEFSAVIEIFDPISNGTVDGYQFVIAFTKLNGIRKDKHAEEVREKQDAFEEAQDDEEDRKQLEAEKRMNMDAVDFDFTQDNRDTAMRKLGQAAEAFDPKHPASPNFDSVAGAFVKPAAFRLVFIGFHVNMPFFPFHTVECVQLSQLLIV